jgi:sugar fermentation stimulation protein A
LKFFGQTEKALFISRPNRFTITCSLNGAVVNAFLPNPGRLLELLLPGAPVYLERVKDPSRDLRFTAVAVENEGERVVLHTLRTNDVARYLIKTNCVPGLEGYEVVRSEVPRGHSRFDFLLKKGNRSLLLEVKSCTLFSKRMAMFPDAVTSRGTRHLRELAKVSDSRSVGAVLFIIHSPRPDFFLPDFHTDLEFGRAMLHAKQRVVFLPMSVQWRGDLSLRSSEAKLLQIPWRILEKELHDRGSYMLILRLPRDTELRIGSLGHVQLRSGFYVYVGSAKKNLSRRIERHRRLRKKLFWHIDFLRAVSAFLGALPVRTEDVLECDLAGAISSMADWSQPGFGSSDCHCPSHLFGFENDPLNIGSFHTLLQCFRMERFIDKYSLT